MHWDQPYMPEERYHVSKDLAEKAIAIEGYEAYLGVGIDVSDESYLDLEAAGVFARD